MLGAPCKSQSCSRASFPALGTVSLPMAGVWKQMIFKIPSNSMIPSSPALLCSSRLCHLPCPFLQGLPAVMLVLGISIFFFFPKPTWLFSGFPNLFPQGAVCDPCSESWEHLLSPTQEGAGSAGPLHKAHPSCSSLGFSGGFQQCTLPSAS